MSASNPAFTWLIMSIIGITAYNLVNFESMGLSKMAITLIRLTVLVFAISLFGMILMII